MIVFKTISDDNKSTNGKPDSDTEANAGSDSESNSNDNSHIVVQRGVITAGSGDDDYIISPVLTDSNTSITITDD